MTRSTPVPTRFAPPRDTEALRALRSKYERMLVLRTAHTRAREDATVAEPDPRAEMARLAEEYPGSLREIDTLPFEIIETRIRLLERAEHDTDAAEPWMHAQTEFHRVARGALAAKRWLAGRKTVTEELAIEFAASLPSLGDEVRLVADDLASIATPPSGRLMAYVYQRVAARLGIEPAQVRALVFLQRDRRR